MFARPNCDLETRMDGSMTTTMKMITYVIRTRGYCKIAVILLTAMLLTACNSAGKKVVTYHVEFMVDGALHSATTKFTWYHADNISTGFSTVNFDNASAHGTLKDGTKYIIYSYDIDYSKSGRTKVDSRIFLQITPNLAESFDKTHFHSPSHTVKIVNSYADIGNENDSSYNEAEDARSASYASVEGSNYYYTVGAKNTPFFDAKSALNDFFNMGPEIGQMPQDYKKPEFSLHPTNANVENSDADITFSDGAFDVSFSSSGSATPWVMAPGVHEVGIGVAGSRPDIAIKLRNERIKISTMVTVNAAVDPETGKVVDFYENDISLRL
jgi:hypothetical protein